MPIGPLFKTLYQAPIAVQSKLEYLVPGPLYSHTTTSMISGVYHFSLVSLHDSTDITSGGEVWKTNFLTKHPFTFLFMAQ